MGLTGSQWGVMNETGSYPGQPWLWLYTLWYQVPGWTNSANIDMIAVYMTGLATILLLCVPFIPGLRDIPRWIPLHRLIWRTPDGGTPTEADGSPVGRGTPASREGTHQLGTVNRVPVCPSSGKRARWHPGHLSERRGLPLTVDTRCRHLSLSCWWICPQYPWSHERATAGVR